MPPHDPKETADFSPRESSQDPAATVDHSRKDAAADLNTTESYATESTAAPGAAGAKRDGSNVVPAIPGFAIEAELGRGGMGVVYRGRQTELNRPVAVKMILGGKYTDAMSQARFLIEAEIIAAVQHPHIVQVYEFGRHDDQPYFVLEFVNGGTLAGRLKAMGRLVPLEAATLVAKLADGMAAAHQKGVVHRDLKPANVLLTETGEPKITDFGLAKMGQSEMTASGAVMGTPSYMSPEQAAGKTREVGTPTDVYALGVILYELTTGRRPFKGETPIDTIQQVLTQEPLRPRLIEPKIPRDLETICLKCMEKDAKKRYHTAAELAAELRAFLEGRPITARPIGLLERSWKWAKRNPGKASGMVASLLLLVLATIAGLVIRDQVEQQRKATHAAGLVQSLLNADTAQVRDLVQQMEDYRQWTDPNLREENEKAADDSREKLHSSLALLSVDPTQVGFLYGRLLGAEPKEVPVIRDFLAPHKDALIPKLWTVVETPAKGKESQRLRAAAALAKYDPASEKWAKAGTLVVNDLVLENPIFLGQWSEAYRPVKSSLLAPLSDYFKDRSDEKAAERTLAANLLADYAADNPQVLADLLMAADGKQFSMIFPKFKDQREKGLPLLTAEIDKTLPPEFPSSDEKREKLAKRQTNAAVALLRLNQPEKVWPLLRHPGADYTSPSAQHRPPFTDPRVRSYLIHRFGPLGADAGTIIQRLEEPDLTIRRALILSLGEFGENELTADARKAFLLKLQCIYRTDPDPGLHGAAEWLLRHWNQECWLKKVNEEWAKKKGKGVGWWVDGKKPPFPSTCDVPPTTPRWFVNSQGQTFVVVPGPVEFLMGSPPSEQDRRGEEIQHKKKIGRVFAIAATSVTMEQYRKFAKDYHVGVAKYHRMADLPAVGIDWHMAARYCNWLSQEEGIPEDQWCFEIKGKDFKLKPGYLSLSGYRLPTEAEMEYATRAGALTARYYGETEELLGKYAWYNKNSQDQPWPVGSLKPNDLGLFDVQGNVYTWCQEGYGAYLRLEDKEDSFTVIPTKSRVLRGASFNNPASFLRSSYRFLVVPSIRFNDFGFRPSRTLPPGAFTASPSTPKGAEK